jgi:phospholipid/cholesterol/gamma-HCH transport system permease protein
MRFTREALFADCEQVTISQLLMQFFSTIGRGSLLTLEAFLLFPFQFVNGRARKEFFRQMYTIGLKSLPVITLVGLFVGMVLALQVGLEMRRYNQEAYVGAGVMISSLREMGPFMAGLILAACVGSSMAAQIGTMVVNDEIAALEIMSINPVRYLVAPRLAAMIIMMPLLSFYLCVLSVLGGGVVAETQLSVPFMHYMRVAVDNADRFDLLVGLLKALIFGILITGVSCLEGLRTTQGAVGVGRATRQSVVSSFLLILVVGYIVTRLFYTL